MLKSPFDNRNQKILFEYLEGDTLKTIGERYGITASGVRTALARHMRRVHPQFYWMLKRKKSIGPRTKTCSIRLKRLRGLLPHYIEALKIPGRYIKACGG